MGSRGLDRSTADGTSEVFQSLGQAFDPTPGGEMQAEMRGLHELMNNMYFHSAPPVEHWQPLTLEESSP